MNNLIGLGDIVDVGLGADYGTCTVSRIHTDGTVDLFRPYTATANFTTSSQDGTSEIICYIGFEEVKRVNRNKLKLLRRNRDLV